MLSPFFMLTGVILLVKEIFLAGGLVERHYSDETGRLAVVVSRVND